MMDHSTIILVKSGSLDYLLILHDGQFLYILFHQFYLRYLDPTGDFLSQYRTQALSVHNHVLPISISCLMNSSTLTLSVTVSNSNREVLANWFLFPHFGTNLVFPYISCGLHSVLLLLRAYIARPQPFRIHLQTHVFRSGVHRDLP
uniref:Uncharacterized protein n=1 Tax=Onchocerca volvulus TaxID=6282 RepID=A0A8R1TJA1_ONCVO